jgi:predicted enzyme related to lactoylglutathione lyase
MKIRATDFVLLPVSDLAVAAWFYREVLGLAQRLYSEEYQWAEFDTGNVTLALHSGRVPGEPAAPGSDCRIALAVDDIDAAFEELKRNGVRRLGEPMDHGVCTHLEVHDPDGHTIILHRRADGTAG